MASAPNSDLLISKTASDKASTSNGVALALPTADVPDVEFRESRVTVPAAPPTAPRSPHAHNHNHNQNHSHDHSHDHSHEHSHERSPHWRARCRRAFGRTARMLIILLLILGFFLVELVVGLTIHALSLVADSFHMISDGASLVVGLFALNVRRK